jgi:cell division protein YceG involved in septum cleavage
MKPTPLWKQAVALILVVVLCLALFVGLIAGFKSFNRYQKRADANNNVKVTNINIRKAQQQARIVHAQNAAVTAKAQQRLIAAKGIKHAQDEIQSTLTPLYVQFEAIEAQKAIAASGKNNTVIYVPAGTNGTPVITQDGKAGK